MKRIFYFTFLVVIAAACTNNQEKRTAKTTTAPDADRWRDHQFLLSAQGLEVGDTVLRHGENWKDLYWVIGDIETAEGKITVVNNIRDVQLALTVRGQSWLLFYNEQNDLEAYSPVSRNALPTGIEKSVLIFPHDGGECMVDLKDGIPVFINSYCQYGEDVKRVKQ